MKIFQEKHGALVDSTPVFLPKYSLHQEEIKDFVQCCLTETRPSSNPQQGVILQKIVSAIYESAKSGEAIKF
uniref:Gfo/Idh/MocA-like oxidoreductase C-terminal domain-containing protein n=1 Tax=Anaerobacillus isosaccharinicus TaxID=1532552 RepID=A0A1S2KUF1_9BACI